MKLAVNYSPASSQLYKEKRITLDLFKCPDWPDMVNAALSEQCVYVHFRLSTGKPGLEQTDWQRITHFLELTGTQQVNLHLITDPSLNPDDPSEVKASIQKIIDQVSAVVDKFSPDKVIIENVPFFLRGHDHLRPIVDPETICNVVEQTGCMLLLDISHAIITSSTLGIDPKMYIQSLPVDRLAELHITGLANEDGQLVDHRAMRDEDWPILEWVLSQIKLGLWANPNILAFEYGGVGEIFSPHSDPLVLQMQVPRLFQLVHS